MIPLIPTTNQILSTRVNIMYLKKDIGNGCLRHLDRVYLITVIAIII